MILDKNRILDGQLSWERGVDTHRSPAQVPRDQACLLVNGTTRKGFVGPRPGWRQSQLVYETDEVEQAFEQGLFQGAAAYNPDSGPSYIMLSISGRIFRVNVLEDGLVQEISLEERNPSHRRQTWWCQVENFMVIQDGQSLPIIWSGASARRSAVDGTGESIDGRPLKEVPVGTCMEYSNGRLWVALPDGRSFVAGDGVYGPTGTTQWGRRDAPLRFSENQFLNGGFPFTVPANMGKITAMKAMAQLDTSLGQGSLQVFTTEGGFSVNVPFEREQWLNVQYPIQAVGLLGGGAVGQASTVHYKSDIWYRTLDGEISSFILAQRDFTQMGNRSMSKEVDLHLTSNDRAQLQYGSACVFDNRLLMTVDPRYSRTRGTYHTGLAVLDFKPLASIGEVKPPKWDGLWTGLDVLQILTVASEGGVNRCFAITLAPADNGVRRIQIWELSLSDEWNKTTTGSKTRTGLVIESPSLDFGNRLEQKLLEGADFWAHNVQGTVDFYLYFKPDQYPCWVFWKHWQVCAKTERCEADAVNGCLTGLNLRPQYRARMSAQRPSAECIAFTRTPARVGYTFQYRLEIVGYAELASVRLLAERILEPTFGACLPEDATCEEIICCPPEEQVSPLTGTDQNTWLSTSGGGSPTTGGGGGTTPPDDPGDGGGGGGGAPTDPEPDEPEPPTTPDPPSGPLPPGVIPTYPGVPTFPNPPSLACEVFEGEWTAPEDQQGSVYGDTHCMGVYDELPTNLEPGVLESWSEQLWDKFGEFVAANHLSIEDAQIIATYAPGTYRRFNANSAFGSNGWSTAVTWPWILQVEYCLQ